jgi:hypothetical protein
MIVDLPKPVPACQCQQPCLPAQQSLGALSLPSLGSLDWRWWLAIAVAAFLAWRVVTRPSRAERRRQLRLARARYQMELAKA